MVLEDEKRPRRDERNYQADFPSALHKRCSSLSTASLYQAIDPFCCEYQIKSNWNAVRVWMENKKIPTQSRGITEVFLYEISSSCWGGFFSNLLMQMIIPLQFSFLVSTNFLSSDRREEKNSKSLMENPIKVWFNGKLIIFRFPIQFQFISLFDSIKRCWSRQSMVNVQTKLSGCILKGKFHSLWDRRHWQAFLCSIWNSSFLHREFVDIHGRFYVTGRSEWSNKAILAFSYITGDERFCCAEKIDPKLLRQSTKLTSINVKIKAKEFMFKSFQLLIRIFTCNRLQH